MLIRFYFEEFSAELVAARENMQQLSRLFTDTSIEGEFAPKIRYSLRGVATKPSTYFNVTYALFPKPSDEMEDSNGALDWWKITYDGEMSSASIEKEASAWLLSRPAMY